MSIKVFCINGRREFLLVKLKEFYKKNGIMIKYIILYIYKKNDIVK